MEDSIGFPVEEDGSSDLLEETDEIMEEDFAPPEASEEPMEGLFPQEASKSVKAATPNQLFI